MYVGGLWSRTITRAGAIAGMLGGAASSLFWMLFFHEKVSTALLLCGRIFGVRSLGIRIVEGKEVFLKAGPFIWAFVDPLIVGLPVAILLTVGVSLATRKFDDAHLTRCFGEK